MAAEDSNGEYEITWSAKPLGFSIVMDTTGRNAYVSSIQKQENLQKGLKLAAQIIKINGDDVKQAKHGEILQKIREATLPMTLTFQPRSFANEPSSERKTASRDDAPPPGLLFDGAPTWVENRVNGMFELVLENGEPKKYNDKHIWQRRDQEETPIVLWFWPADQNEFGKDLWMIGRENQMGQQGAYACCETSLANPLNIRKKWNVFNKTSRAFEPCEIEIKDGVDPNSIFQAGR